MKSYYCELENCRESRDGRVIRHFTSALYIPEKGIFTSESLFSSFGPVHFSEDTNERIIKAIYAAIDNGSTGELTSRFGDWSIVNIKPVEVDQITLDDLVAKGKILEESRAAIKSVMRPLFEQVRPILIYQGR